MVEVEFGPTLDILKEEYLNVYEEIQSEIVNTTRLDENPDLSTTYLGKSDRPKNDRMSISNRYRCKQIIYVKNLSICIVSHFILYQNLLQRHKEIR